MKNQTDRFYTAAIVFAGRSVYTTLFEPPPSPHTMAKLGARERHGMLGLLLQLEYGTLSVGMNSQKPGARSRLFCHQNYGPRWVSVLNAGVCAGPLFYRQNRALRERILG